MHLRRHSHPTTQARGKPAPRPHGVTARLNYLRIAVAGAYACGILLSPGLWFSAGRTFPRAPLLSGLPAYFSSFDYLLSILLLIALTLAAASRRPRRYLVAAVALTALLVVLDQTRLQPWVYQYLIMLAALACERPGAADVATAEPILAANQLVVATLYFWSGAQKLNWSFGHEVMPGLLEQAGIHLPAAYASYLPAASVGVAVCEALMGAALLVRRTRQAAVLLALGMHLLVLLMLIAASSNSVVWAWNIGMMVMVALLFWRFDQRLDYRALRRFRGADASSHVARVVLIVCGLAPALSFVGWWDMYLSAALYSGTTPVGVIRISERVGEQLPVSAQQQIFKTRSGELMLPLYEWSLAELNVPPYPETRVYRQLARQVCEDAEERQEIELVVKERPSPIDGSYAVRRFDCPNLLAR